jgi:hypothetical protein
VQLRDRGRVAWGEREECDADQELNANHNYSRDHHVPEWQVRFHVIANCRKRCAAQVCTSLVCLACLTCGCKPDKRANLVWDHGSSWLASSHVRRPKHPERLAVPPNNGVGPDMTSAYGDHLNTILINRVADYLDT